jgi:hypothetical protein
MYVLELTKSPTRIFLLERSIEGSSPRHPVSSKYEEKVIVVAEAVCVAAADMVIWVGESTLTIVAPFGIPEPKTFSPMKRPLV